MSRAQRYESLTNPNGETTGFTYSPNGLLQSATDANGHTTAFSYTADGRLAGRTDAEGGAETLTRTTVPVPYGTGYAVQHTTATGVSTNYQVEFLGTGDQRRTTTLPDGTQQTTLVGFDATTTVTNPDGSTQTVAEGPDPRFGMQAALPTGATVTSPGGLQAAITSNRTTTVTDPTNALSLATQTDTVTVNGRTITSAYTAATRTELTTSPAGRQTTTVTDTDGRVVLSQLDSLTPSEFSYDAAGRLDGIAQGTRITSFGYDAGGRLATMTDPLGRSVGFQYDDAGRVTQQTLPDGRAVTYAYDASGNLTAITPPGRPAHAFSYTRTNEPLRYTPPQPSPVLPTPQTQYQYNLMGQLARIIRPDGQAIALSYDLAGRVAAQITPAGTVVYGYDPETGNVDRVTAADGGWVGYQFDGQLPTQETWSGTVTGSVSRTYDSNYRVTSQSVNGANTVTFTYDADDLLTGAGALTITRNAQNGLLTGTTLGTVTDTTTYDTFGAPATYDATANPVGLFHEVYTRDGLGRIAQKVETVEGVTTTYGYAYDPAGRLTDVTTNDTATAHYEYDLNGNRVADANTDGLTTFTGPQGALLSADIDDQDRLLSYTTTTGGTTAFEYTANGELSSKTDSTGTTTYAYDVLGNLLRVDLPDGRVIEYVVDGQNRRVGKKVNGTLVQGFLYDGQLRIVAELDGNGAVVSRFVYGIKANAPDYLTQGGSTYRVISDHLGSPRLVVDVGTGAVAQQMDFDEFGNVLADASPGFQPFGFAGGLYDRDTGLVRFGARDYQPDTGRWTSRDPIGFEGGDGNLYGYAGGDPINGIDPDGTFSTLTEIAVASGIVNGLLNGVLQAPSGQHFSGKGAAIGFASGFVSAYIGGAVVRSAFNTAVISAGNRLILSNGNDIVSRAYLENAVAGTASGTVCGWIGTGLGQAAAPLSPHSGRVGGVLASMICSTARARAAQFLEAVTPR